MKELLQDHYNYTLYEKEGKLLLSVVCGTVAVFDLTIELTQTEAQKFEQEGQAFIASFADTIRYAPDDYLKRRV
jgi:hypothetical protein